MLKHFERIESAIRDLRAGKMIILTDHPDRENEGDLICPAEIITPEIVNFMIRNGTGIVCLSLTATQINKLGLSFMVPPHENTSRCATPFTVSIEAKQGISTGVSAKDRATTILTALKEEVTASDIVKPGHIFPLHAKDEGVLERPGHTEGAIDIVKLAGFKPAAVLCEVMNADGTMAKGKQLMQFAAQHQLQILSIEDILQYRLAHENLITDEVSSALPIEPYGLFEITVIKEKIKKQEHIVLTKHHETPIAPPLVRIHSACVTGDLFGSKRCDCRKQLEYALMKISAEGGILIYLNQEGRGIGLFNKIKAYALQEQGFDTIEANIELGLPVDMREYYIAANILRNRNIKNIRLLTNNPHKVNNLNAYGINVQMENMPAFYNQQNKHYLLTKKDKLNHVMNGSFEDISYAKY